MREWLMTGAGAQTPTVDEDAPSWYTLEEFVVKPQESYPNFDSTQKWKYDIKFDLEADPHTVRSLAR